MLKADTTEEEEGIAFAAENAESDWGNILSEDSTNATSTTLDDVEDDGKPMDEMKQLSLMFPTINSYTLKHTLDKNQNNVDNAINELLNYSFLDEEGTNENAKGISGFAEEFIVPGKKKGKKKGRNVKTNFSDDESGYSTPNTSKWDDVNSQADDISNKLGIPRTHVRSALHKFGTRSAALQPLVTAHGECSNTPETSSHLENINKITAIYPRLDTSLVNGLLKLCKSDMVVARNYAELMDRNQTRILNSAVASASSSKRPVSLDQPLLPADWQKVANRRSLNATKVSVWDARTIAAAHADARNEAYDKAQQAHRKAKSDRTMGGAATYYAEEGKKHALKMKDFSDFAAEQLVNENSSGNTLDLHGVTVEQAVKITRERVTAWWALPKSADSRKTGQFHVITGMGRHSKNGDSRLGPAVSKMLMRERWRIQVNQGYITVLGAQQNVGVKK